MFVKNRLRSNSLPSQWLEWRILVSALSFSLSSWLLWSYRWCIQVANESDVDANEVEKKLNLFRQSTPQLEHYQHLKSVQRHQPTLLQWAQRLFSMKLRCGEQRINNYIYLFGWLLGLFILNFNSLIDTTYYHRSKYNQNNLI